MVGRYRCLELDSSRIASVESGGANLGRLKTSQDELQRSDGGSSRHTSQER